MPEWKLRMFVRVIKARMELEQITAEEALEAYPALTEGEKQAILQAITEL